MREELETGTLVSSVLFHVPRAIVTQIAHRSLNHLNLRRGIRMLEKVILHTSFEELKIANTWSILLKNILVNYGSHKMENALFPELICAYQKMSAIIKPQTH